jgi:hypothetical protein
MNFGMQTYHIQYPYLAYRFVYSFLYGDEFRTINRLAVMAKHHGFQAIVNKLIFVNYMMSKIYKHIHIHNVRIIYKRIMNYLFTTHINFKRNLIQIKNETHFSIKATYR